MKQNNTRVRNRRRMTTTTTTTIFGFVIWAAATVGTSNGFISSAAMRSSNQQQVSSSIESLLSTKLPLTITSATAKGKTQSAKQSKTSSSSSTSSSYDKSTSARRQSHEEQQELLQKTVEMRRIKNVENELKLRPSAPTTTPLSITVSRAAGYGEEMDLMDAAVSEGEAAREALITGNMGLVHFCVNDILSKRRKQQQLQSLSKEDLIQEGAIGLARAIDRWNPEIGGKFSTYAVYWIRAAVLRCIAERDDFVRVPEHVSAAVRRVTRAAKTLGLNIDEDYEVSPLWREAKAAKALAEEAGLTDKQLVEAMKVRQRRQMGILSYESWMQKKQDYETDLIAKSGSYEMPHVDDDLTHLKATLSRFLRPKEIEALSWRYGLNLAPEQQQQQKLEREKPTRVTSTGLRRRNYLEEAEQELFPSRKSAPLPAGGRWGEAMSFNEVGSRMHVSAEYGRKLCNAALEKLRRAAEEGALEPALLL